MSPLPSSTTNSFNPNNYNNDMTVGVDNAEHEKIVKKLKKTTMILKATKAQLQWHELRHKTTEVHLGHYKDTLSTAQRHIELLFARLEPLEEEKKQLEQVKAEERRKKKEADDEAERQRDLQRQEEKKRYENASALSKLLGTVKKPVFDAMAEEENTFKYDPVTGRYVFADDDGEEEEECDDDLPPVQAFGKENVLKEIMIKDDIIVNDDESVDLHHKMTQLQADIELFNQQASMIEAGDDVDVELNDEDDGNVTSKLNNIYSLTPTDAIVDTTVKNHVFASTPGVDTSTDNTPFGFGGLKKKTQKATQAPDFNDLYAELDSLTGADNGNVVLGRRGGGAKAQATSNATKKKVVTAFVPMTPIDDDNNNDNANQYDNNNNNNNILGDFGDVNNGVGLDENNVNNSEIATNEDNMNNNIDQIDTNIDENINNNDQIDAPVELPYSQETTSMLQEEPTQVFEQTDADLPTNDSFDDYHPQTSHEQNDIVIIEQEGQLQQEQVEPHVDNCTENIPLSTYMALQEAFNALEQQYTPLLNEYNNVSEQLNNINNEYSVMSQQYTPLMEQYNLLLEAYNGLQQQQQQQQQQTDQLENVQDEQNQENCEQDANAEIVENTQRVENDEKIENGNSHEADDFDQIGNVSPPLPQNINDIDDVINNIPSSPIASISTGNDYDADNVYDQPLCTNDIIIDSNNNQNEFSIEPEQSKDDLDQHVENVDGDGVNDNVNDDNTANDAVQTDMTNVTTVSADLYNQLCNEYTNLGNNYQQLQEQFTLLQEYNNDLAQKHHDLTFQYTTIDQNYQSLQDNYNNLLATSADNGTNGDNNNNNVIVDGDHHVSTDPTVDTLIEDGPLITSDAMDQINKVVELDNQDNNDNIENVENNKNEIVNLNNENNEFMITTLRERISQLEQGCYDTITGLLQSLVNTQHELISDPMFGSALQAVIEANTKFVNNQNTKNDEINTENDENQNSVNDENNNDINNDDNTNSSPYDNEHIASISNALLAINNQMYLELGNKAIELLGKEQQCLNVSAEMNGLSEQYNRLLEAYDQSSQTITAMNQYIADNQDKLNSNLDNNNNDNNDTENNNMKDQNQNQDVISQQTILIEQLQASNNTLTEQIMAAEEQIASLQAIVDEKQQIITNLENNNTNIKQLQQYPITPRRSSTTRHPSISTNDGRKSTTYDDDDGYNFSETISMLDNASVISRRNYENATPHRNNNNNNTPRSQQRQGHRSVVKNPISYPNQLIELDVTIDNNANLGDMMMMEYEQRFDYNDDNNDNVDKESVIKMMQEAINELIERVQHAERLVLQYQALGITLVSPQTANEIALIKPNNNDKNKQLVVRNSNDQQLIEATPDLSTLQHNAIVESNQQRLFVEVGQKENVSLVVSLNSRFITAIAGAIGAVAGAAVLSGGL